MSNEQLRKQLLELKTELGSSTLDSQTHDLLHSLDASLHASEDGEATPDDSSVLLEQARDLEARFAVSHPVAEKFMRNIVETLARIGV